MKQGFLTSFHLKLIAIIAMTIDHFATIIGQVGLMTMFPNATLQTTYQIIRIMNGVGRIAFPLFAFMIAEGVMRTRSMPRYIGRLALFAIISEPFYYFAFSPTTPTLAGLFESLAKLHLTNIFATLALGAIAIYIYQLLERRKSKKLLLLFIPIALLIVFIGGMIHCDYGAQGVILIIVLYFAKTKPLKMLVVLVWSLCVYLLWMGSIAHGIFAALSCAFIWLYNGKRGIPIKWSFYVYYPLHILLLTLLASALK